MKQKFFTNTIKSKFIKSLLYNTYLPRYTSVSDGDYIVEGVLYIYNFKVIRCSYSGFLGTNAEYDVISQYEFGGYYPKFTERHISTYNYYDSETHKRLGTYLRCYRDLYGINLMPFYNCFNGDYQSGIYLNEDGVNKTSKDMGVKVFKIPIKFNKNYTIAIDSGSKVCIAPVVMVDNNLVSVTMNDSTVYDLTDDISYVDSGNIQVYTDTSFKNPIVYGVATYKSFHYIYESDLYMLIQVSDKNNSSLVVLEGDYSDINTEKIINVEGIEELSDAELNQYLISKLSLLQINDEVRYPFADRLMEYLLLNVISSRDEIGDNVYRYSYHAISPYDTSLYIRRERYVWTPQFRKAIYDLCMKADGMKRLDVNGFIDVESERILNIGG